MYMRVARAVSSLIEAFERLPGIGPKSAQRLTYYLLHVPQSELDKFSLAVSNLKRNTVTCSRCHNIAETDPCDVCNDGGRDKTTICVVEQPLDVLAIERSRRYQGIYHVLHGVIDPLHNIGPEEIYITTLLERVKNMSSGEVILALNSTMEGEATSMYLQRMLAGQPVKVTRLAAGLPMGSDIEYADEITLARALEGRREY